MQYWNKNGNIHDDSLPDAGIAQQAYNKAIAGLTNAKNWLNEENSNSDAYKQKINTILGIELLFTPTALKNSMRPFTTAEMVEKFFNNPYIEESPPLYQGERNIQKIIDYFGNNGIIKTPKDKVITNKNNLGHYAFENNPERLEDLGKVKRTFESPDLIIKGQRYGKDFQYYAKPFKHKGEVRGHLNITRNKPNGNFYQTNFNLRGNKLKDLINDGQVIFNNLPVSTAPILKNMPVNNIINDLKRFFNP